MKFENARGAIFFNFPLISSSMTIPFNPMWLVWLIPVLVWEAVWKGIGLWKAGKNNQLNWFVAIFILNTAGILPIIYLKFYQKKQE